MPAANQHMSDGRGRAEGNWGGQLRLCDAGEEIDGGCTGRGLSSLKCMMYRTRTPTSLALAARYAQGSKYSAAR